MTSPFFSFFVLAERTLTSTFDSDPSCCVSFVGMTLFRLLGGLLGGACVSAAASSASVFASPAAATDTSVAPAPVSGAGYRTWGTKWDANWDSPGARGVAPATLATRAERQLLLIRHGQYQNESLDDDSTRTLTAKGIEQATLTGEFLALCFAESGLVCATKPHAVYASDLTRAKQTAELILAGLRTDAKLMIDPGLRERFPCDPQPPYPKKARRSSEEKVEAAFHQHFYRPLHERSTTEVLVCHANVIRYFTCRALQIPPEAWLRFSLPHCSVTSVTINARGRVSVSMMGAASHLPPRLHTVMNIA